MDLSFNYASINPIATRALAFASAAHANQKRKYSDNAYIVHPIAVANLIKTLTDLPKDGNAVAAAYLHDTVEDTAVTLGDIQMHFGQPVTEYVHYLTKVSKKEDGNRAYRTAMDREWFAKGGHVPQTIKLCDIYDNARDIIVSNPRFAKTYIPECIAIAKRMSKALPHLQVQVVNLLDEYRKDLENEDAKAA